MPCRDETHEHHWPKEGTLIICKCEIFCGYCDEEDAKQVHQHQWQLREHVREVHARGQGLSITVSPRPMPHVSTASKKRNHAELEKSDSNEDNGSDEKESSEEADEDESKDEESQTKSNSESSSSSAPSDPFVEDDKDDTKSSPTPLRLRAKPVAKAKKTSIKDHAASFQPIGPKPGPSSPKRAKQETSMRPPLPVAANIGPGLPPQAPTVHQQQHYRMQEPARVVSTQPGPRLQRSGAQLQQVPTRRLLPAGSMVPPVNHPMVPPMNPQPEQMPGQNYGRVNPPLGQTAFPIHPPGQYMYPQMDSREFYRTFPHLITQTRDTPERQRLRNLTTHLLTHSNANEQVVIQYYEREAEFVRQLQTTRHLTVLWDQMLQETSQEIERQVVLQTSPGSFNGLVMDIVWHSLQSYGLVPRPQVQGHQMPGGQQQGPQFAQQPGVQQQGGQQPQVSRPVQQFPRMQQSGQAQQVGGQQVGQQPQQSGSRVMSGGQQSIAQQPGPYPPGPQQFAPQQSGPIRHAPQQSGPQQYVAQPIAQPRNGQQFGPRQPVSQQLGPVQSVPQQPVQPPLQQVGPHQHHVQQLGSKPPVAQPLNGQQVVPQQPVGHQHHVQQSGAQQANTQQPGLQQPVQPAPQQPSPVQPPIQPTSSQHNPLPREEKKAPTSPALKKEST